LSEVHQKAPAIARVCVDQALRSSCRGQKKSRGEEASARLRTVRSTAVRRRGKLTTRRRYDRATLARCATVRRGAAKRVSRMTSHSSGGLGFIWSGPESCAFS